MEMNCFKVNASFCISPEGFLHWLRETLLIHLRSDFRVPYPTSEAGEDISRSFESRSVVRSKGSMMSPKVTDEKSSQSSLEGRGRYW
ncbi:hypothetical protein CRYUN_Cryun32bG0066300 [Craigia yunnanensis]